MSDIHKAKHLLFSIYFHVPFVLVQGQSVRLSLTAVNNDFLWLGYEQCVQFAVP